MSESLYLQAEVTSDRLSRSDWIRLVWGFAWRGLCFVVGCGVAGFVIGSTLGFAVGFFATVIRIPRDTYELPLRLFSGVLALVIGLWLYTFYIRWLLRSHFGSLRLALVRVSA